MKGVMTVGGGLVPLPRARLHLPSVRESTVGSRVWITAQADGGDLVNLGRHRVRHTARAVRLDTSRTVHAGLPAKRLVYGATAQPAVVLFAQHAATQLVSTVPVGATRVAH